jgi:two-component system response regulator HydG
MVHDLDAELTTLLSSRFDPTPQPDVAFAVQVIEGPDRGGAFVVDGSQPSRVLVGTSPACNLQLTDRETSRRHAALEIAGSRLRITDLGSKNGTRVNGVAVTDAFLVGGETVASGTSKLRADVQGPVPSQPLPFVARFGRMIGASTEMRRLYPLCDKLAASTVPVIIEGETGTGKEVLAESIHEAGPRARGPFVVFDCTTVPGSLVESELFGHERGAFTGATSTRKGVFELAHGGTLLIDEIGDLDPSLQPKLLRAVERSELRRVGGDRSIRVDVRVLAATRRDLDAEVQAGRFRDDLFHRLAVTRIELPPLRARRGDITILARWFWREIGGDHGALPKDVLRRWERDPWPGNVRALRNAVARQLALGELAQVEEAGGAGPPAAAMKLPFPRARQAAITAFEQQYVTRVLAEHGGDVARAAAASGIGRRYFQMLRLRIKK